MKNDLDKEIGVRRMLVEQLKDQNKMLGREL